jgi:hypothetical protein
MTPSDNLGTMMTRRIRSADGTTVLLNYQASEANAMRQLVQSIRIKGDRRPSLSLIARRSMQLYVARMETAQRNRPDVFASEVADLEQMVTLVPAPAQHSKRRPSGGIGSQSGAEETHRGG